MLTRLTLPATLAIAMLGSSARAQQHDHPAGAHDGPASSPMATEPSERDSNAQAIPGRAPADSSQPTVGPHGGMVVQAGVLQFECTVQPSGLRLFAYDRQGAAIDLRAARGIATLQLKGGAKRYRYDLFPEVRQDGAAVSVAAAVDLRRIAGRPVQLAFQIVGVPGAEQRPLAFAAHTTAPLNEERLQAAAIAAQGVCPVSGEPLGSMGKPIAVTAGGQSVFVCCAGCVDTVKENPAKYFARKPEIKVVQASNADAQAIAQQKLCPVMDEPLGSMGTPLKVTGLERDIYLCCKGCVKFIEKDPAKYLAKLPRLPTAKPTVVKATRADARFATAQKLCPVMDEPLDAMGGPYKTVVNGRIVYLCCPGCAKKLQAEPAMYFAKLERQGVSPPAIQPVAHDGHNEHGARDGSTR